MVKAIVVIKLLLTEDMDLSYVFLQCFIMFMYMCNESNPSDNCKIIGCI